jgi:Ca-activated chloride channel family protein
MKSRVTFVLFAALGIFLFFALAPAYADGIIIPDPPPCPTPCPDCPPQPCPPPAPAPLAIKYHRVDVTIEDQVATTHVDQVFVNEAGYAIEGTYIFPLPEEAAISEFSMWVDGEKVEGKVLGREEARRIYEDIVRRRRDPALLEYIGKDMFQASIFPIPPGGERRVELTYSQILPLDNGLVRYVYPLSTEKFSSRPLQDVSVRVEVRSQQPLKAIYSSSHKVAVDRPTDYRAVVGYEDSNVTPDKDFVLYYTVSQEKFGLNLLSYKASGEDGFFLLLVAPNVEVAEQEVVAKDVIFVLDTSGSMEGEKIEQARDALEFVLDHLNGEDRFNIVSFSTGVRSYASGLRPAEERGEARRFVRGLNAAGGTDINRAMLEALAMADKERPTIIIFLTDGLPTEGTVEVDTILDNIEQAARGNVRIFPFGVGDDVNTLLLDTMARNHRGASAYVRPGQSIEEEVSAFYAKVSTPLLADVSLDFGRVRVEDSYPYPLPDLFAGTQLVLVGRYREGGPATVTLRGTVNNREQTFVYEDQTFRQSGGEEFIARLWATRKIGHLLEQIRLHGETKELVDEIVSLSIRYGIITPYTSFLVQEPDALTEEGRRRIADQTYQAMSTATPAPAAGAPAVDKSQAEKGLGAAEVPAEPAHGDLGGGEGAGGGPGEAEVRALGEKAFILRDGIWTDTAFDPSKMQTVEVTFGSQEFFDMLAAHPEWGKYFALGPHVIVVLEGQAYEMVEGEAAASAAPASGGSQGGEPSPPTATPAALNPAPTTGSDPSAKPTPASPASSTCFGSIGLLLIPLLGLAFGRQRK